MGMIVHIYRSPLGDATNGGASSKVEMFTITNVEGPFDPQPTRPAARLESHVRGCLRIVPENGRGGAMFGGNYATTSDDRFSRKCEALLGHRFYGAVAIHDRWES